jgi:dissimilatory sulfite reductase (desulfoviridin) alpha/beta subunit
LEPLKAELVKQGLPKGGTGHSVTNIVHTQGWIHSTPRPSTPPVLSRPLWTTCTNTSAPISCRPRFGSLWPAA